MKYATSLSILLSLLLISSCTENARTRQFGGKEEIKLKDHEVLINMTWKEADLWILTEDTITHTQHFRESSSWGVWEGEITIQ